MAVSRLNTYGMLDKWRAEMDVNIWHFNQLTGQGSNAPLAVPGQFVYVQPERERIAEGLNKALDLALRHLRFYPRPTYTSDTVRLGKRRAFRWQEVVLPKRYIDAIGKRATTVIEADAAVAYSDPFTEGVNTLATITVTLPADVTDPAEVQVFFTVADSLGEQAAEIWRIEPLEVSIVGTTATITGHRALFAKPSLWAVPYDGSFGQPSKNEGNVQSAGDFVTEVDVVRVYADTTGAVTLKCRTACCSSTGFDTYAGGAYIIDAEAGVIGLTADGCTCGSRRDTYLEIFYRAGYPEAPLSGVDGALTMALVHLANAKMTTPVGPDDAGNNRWYADKQVIPRSELNESERNNPFGFEVGSVQAWNMLSGMQQHSMRAML